MFDGQYTAATGERSRVTVGSELFLIFIFIFVPPNPFRISNCTW